MRNTYHRLLSTTECSQPFNLTLQLDQFPDETSWAIKDFATNATLFSEGPYRDEDDSKEIQKYYCLTNITSTIPCYSYTLYDIGGDGICCSFGDGSYRVYFQGKEIRVGGPFSNKTFETTVFGIGCPSNSTGSSSTGRAFIALSIFIIIILLIVLVDKKRKTMRTRRKKMEKRNASTAAASQYDDDENDELNCLTFLYDKNNIRHQTVSDESHRAEVLPPIS